MINMPIEVEPYDSYINRLIKETHDMVKEIHNIVRCKDCKYWTEDVPHNAYCEIMKLHGFEPDDFYSRGERKDEQD